MKARKNFIGLEGFVWWVGVVEDRQDPEQLGRVRVRCFGWHTEDKKKIATNDLPWAHPTIPVNHPALYTPKEGDMVFGFFMDGDNAQNPVIMGVFPGKPEKKPRYEDGFSDPRKSFGDAPKRPDDNAEAYPKSKYLKEATTNRLARGKADSTIIATRKKNLKKGITSTGGVSWAEPAPAFAPKYPYNYALESESGHAFELDDTPGKERVHLAHRKGTFIEIDQEGSEVHKVVKDNYTLVMGSDYVYVAGKCSVTIDGDCNLQVGGNMNIAATGDIRMKGKAIFIESTSTTDIKIGEEGRITSSKKLNLKGATATLQGATIDLPAAQINMQSGSADSASGTGLTGGGQTPTETEAAAATAATQTSAATTANATSSTSNTAASSTSASSSNTAAAGKSTAGGGSLGGSAGSALGKVVSGVTSSISGVVGDLKGMLDSTIKDLSSALPLGEITAKVANIESAINDVRGDVLSLTGSSKTEVFGKIDQVAKGAEEKGIEFNVDNDIQKEINKVKNKGLAEITTMIGKQIYPKTETVSVTPSSANTGG